MQIDTRANDLYLYFIQPWSRCYVPNSSCYLTSQTMFTSKCDGITWEAVKVVSEEGRNWYSGDLIGNICAPIQMDRNTAKLMFQSCVTNMNRSFRARSWENSRKIPWTVRKPICIESIFVPCYFSKAKSNLSGSLWAKYNTTHYYSSATHLRNNHKSSAPEDGHKVARNMLSNLKRRNKHNTKSDI